MIWDQSEAIARAVIRDIPDGTYAAEAFLDNDGLNAGTTVPLKVKVDRRRRRDDHRPLRPAAEAQVHHERRPQRRRAVGGAARVPLPHHPERGRQRRQLPPAPSRAARRHGDERQAELGEGPLQSRAAHADRPCHPGAGLGAAAGRRRRPLRDVLHHPLCRQPAGQQCAVPVQRFSGFGGWGALCDEDGPGPFRTMCHGDTRSIPIEVQEASYPIEIENYALRTDSGGAGAIPRRAWAEQKLRRARALHVHLDLRPHAVPALGTQWRPRRPARQRHDHLGRRQRQSPR